MRWLFIAGLLVSGAWGFLLYGVVLIWTSPNWVPVTLFASLLCQWACPEARRRMHAAFEEEA